MTSPASPAKSAEPVGAFFKSAPSRASARTHGASDPQSWRSALRALLAFVLAALICAALPAAACADDMSSDDATASEDAAASEDADDEEEPLGLSTKLLRLSGETIAAEEEDGLVTETTSAVFPGLLSITTTPSVISTGIACSMEDMCGIDPCTCGKPDAWGACACGGTEDTSPTITVASSDPGVARAVSAFGRMWIVPISCGTTTIQITAELIHYQDASYSFEVQVQPFGAMDVALILASAVLLAALVLGVFLLVRLLVRAIRRALARRRRWKERGEELKMQHPLTWRAKLATEKHAHSRRGRARREGRRHPFAHDFGIAMRHALPVLVAGLAVFVVLVPVSTSIIDEVSIFNVDYTHEQLKYQFYNQDLGMAVNVACAAFGAVLAIALYRFLLQKRSTTAFLSVGLSRVKLFFSRYLVGALCIILAVGLPFAISLGMNVASLGLYEGELHEFVYVTCGYLLVALVAFSLASIATVRSGTLFEACAFSLALLCGVSVVLWGGGVLAQNLLVGNAAGAALYGSDTAVAPSYLDDLSWLNPLLFFADEGASHQYFEVLHPVYYPEYSSARLLVAWLAVFVALSALALGSFCGRSGEQAEMAGKAPVLSLFSVAVFGLAAFAAAVSLVGELDVGVALAAGAAVFVLVSLGLLFGPLRGRNTRRSTLGCVAGELCAMACVVVAFATGGFGYSSYVPETEEVESVEVSYVGSPSYLTEGFSGISSDNSYYYTSYRSYSDSSSIDIVRSLQSQLAASAREEWATDYDDFESSVVPYDVVIRYTLSDGGEVVRYYDQATIAELESLLSLDNDEHSRLLETAAITGNTDGLTDEEKEDLTESPSYNAYQTGSIYLGDGALNRIIEVELSDEERAELLEALASDLSSLSAAERYSPSSAAVAVLMFTQSPEIDVSSFGYSFSNAVSYITEDWTATMAWLEDQGLIDDLGGTELDPLIIESLTLQLDDPYASVNEVSSPVSRYFMGYRTEVESSFWITQDYGSLTEITDQEEIAELLPELRLGCYMSGGYLVQAKLRGIEAYVYFYLPAEAAIGYV